MDFKHQTGMSVGSYYRNFWLYNALIAKDSAEGDVLLYCSFYSRSKVMATGVASSLSLNNAEIGYRRVNSKGQEYAKAYKPVRMGLDRFTLATVVNKAVGKKFLLSSPEFLEEDFYNFLMSNFQVELLPAWTPVIKDELISRYLVRKCSQRYGSYYEFRSFGSDEEGTTVTIHEKEVPVDQVEIYDFSALTEEAFEGVIVALGDEGKIRISDTLSEKMDIPTLNDYITVFGRKGAVKIAENTTPLVPEEEAGRIDDVALNTAHLIPQQERCVNGVAALMRHHKRFALMVEGMGCGKTKQSIAAVLLNENRKAMEKYGDPDLKEMYENGHEPHFRAIVMCPPHLCEMWKREWEKEVPNGTAHILTSETGLSDLITLRDNGPKRTGAELYVISKEFAKTGGTVTPIPSQTATVVPKGVICADCDETRGEHVYKPNGKRPVCPKCGGKHWKTIDLTSYGRQYAMLCPECGAPLLRYSAKYYEQEAESLTLKPIDFANHKDSNDTCYVCGAHLWGVDGKNIGADESNAKGRAWEKVSHFKNLQKKSRMTSFVLKGHESEYLNAHGLPTEESRWEEEGISWQENISGPRKASPAQFIKKHLKGFFDYCILDEAHKYEGAGTAQAVAAQALIKASGFTIALTGTISNGKASSLFYLLWMLCPRKMVKKGYSYSDEMQFSKDYGCVETVYESGADPDDEQRNANSRGRQRGQAKVKPGISPLLQLDFLTGHAVFLDLSDMADALPPLNEIVVTARLPEDVQKGYDSLMYRMGEVVRQKGGRSYLASWLQTSLAYPSKPWGVSPIMSVDKKGVIICEPDNFPEYESLENLLPKEQMLIEKVQEEIEADRNIFIYCSFTGDPQKNCTGRLKALIEHYCNLKGHVLIMEAGSPEAIKREEYIHQKASEGYRVIICNQKLVETGLDFCFTYNGKFYDYPTIMVYQITYELAVQMQSTRRHYRLNQTMECRTYYFVTEGTAEMAALSLMADKQVAAAALQGNFNTEGLSAMASGVDDKVKLVQMMTNGDMGDTKAEIEAKFGKLQSSQSHVARSVDELFNAEGCTKTYAEVMGLEDLNVVAAASAEEVSAETAEKPAEPKKAVTKAPARKTAKKKETTMFTQFSLFDIADAAKPHVADPDLEDRDSAKKSKDRTVEGQVSLFDLFSDAA